MVDNAPTQWLKEHALSFEARESEAKNLHIVWEKTVAGKKLVVAALHNEEEGCDYPKPFGLVYERGRLKHAFLIDPLQQRVWLENYKLPEPAPQSLRNYSPEFLYFYYLTKTFRDGSFAALGFPTDDSEKEACWKTLPRIPTPKKYLIGSAFECIGLLINQAARIDSQEMKALPGRLLERFYEIMEKHIKKHPEHGLEIANIIFAASANLGWVKTPSKELKESVTENVVFTKLKAIYDTLEAVEKEKEVPSYV